MGNEKTEFGWNFDNTYLRLPDIFFERVRPTPVGNPKLVLFNHDLAETLGLNAEELAKRGADFFAGNQIFQGSEPIAQAYAGHQFGHFTMLGDGRANLLGEHVTPGGNRFDIQLKGSGPTQFSRRGDGRAALGPMLREYIISEATHALGIPTTRSLAVVTTGESVMREQVLPGAVLTRIAGSHIRVGTFEYASALGNPENLRRLADYTLQRHDPELASRPEPYLAFLQAVIERQAALISKWMHVGFIHGVMNTDNMALSGETIDYGPCAFMDRYSLSTVFSSIDRHGRYAYGQQPKIAEWNLTRFAETLLPLLSSDEKEAIAKAEEALGAFGAHLHRHWMTGMREKLGLTTDGPDDKELIFNLLGQLERHEADYTHTFRILSSGSLTNYPLFKEPEFLEWHKRWQERNPSFDLMRSKNPVVIPRNHLVEQALSAAVEKDDYSVLERLLKVLKTPFEEPAQGSEYVTPPAKGSERYQTFCGT